MIVELTSLSAFSFKIPQYILLQDDGSEEYGQSLPMCPVDCCSGVVLHLFLSSPQDLPEGSHASVGPLGCGIDPKWAEVMTALCELRMPTSLQESCIRSTELLKRATLSLQDIATLFARKSLSVSLWSVVSFEGQGVGLKELAPLAELTGGAVRHTALLANPLMCSLLDLRAVIVFSILR